MSFSSIESVQEALRSRDYIAERGLATSIFLALKLGRPLFLEGEAGVGKTEVARALSLLLGTDLIRLQCYEGLDVNQAVYEWNYTRQILHLRLMEARGEQPVEAELFGPEFLLKRPLLQAIDPAREAAPVLLIDELDRSDDEFEAFLLEVLSEYQITIPEIGTLRARHTPVTIITSNRTREVHDALKRRCLYAWIDYPSYEKELQIMRVKVPAAPDQLARQVATFIQELRRADLYKAPGVAETLDWTTALVALDQRALELSVVNETLGVILKYQDDVDKIRGDQARVILDRVQAIQSA